MLRCSVYRWRLGEQDKFAFLWLRTKIYPILDLTLSNVTPFYSIFKLSSFLIHVERFCLKSPDLLVFLQTFNNFFLLIILNLDSFHVRKYSMTLNAQSFSSFDRINFKRCPFRIVWCAGFIGVLNFTCEWNSKSNFCCDIDGTMVRLYCYRHSFCGDYKLQHLQFNCISKKRNAILTKTWLNTMQTHAT